jgi:tetratricopeptide (TPR) repeat protein
LKAIEDFNEAIDWGFYDADVYCRRASAYKDSGELGRAVDDFARCISLDPTRVDVHLSLGITYRKLDLPDYALEEFNEYLLMYSQAPDREQVEQWIRELESDVVQ